MRQCSKRYSLQPRLSVLFSEPKIPQSSPICAANAATGSAFSALQRAENSSMDYRQSSLPPPQCFQCSSASRKFLNLAAAPSLGAALIDFQCSSASRKFLNRSTRVARQYVLHFQCSSASRKFLNITKQRNRILHQMTFSALQRAENSSIYHIPRRLSSGKFAFQCSSASRKFLNPGA